MGISRKRGAGSTMNSSATGSARSARKPPRSARPKLRLAGEPVSVQEKQTLGAAAHKMLLDPLVNLAFRSMLDEIQTELRDTPREASATREILYLEMRVATRFLDRLARFHHAAQQISDAQRENERRIAADAAYDPDLDLKPVEEYI